MERWNGRVALVTGASAGIGAAFCRGLVIAGMKVVGAARRVDRIEKLADELKNEKGTLTAIACDVSKDEDVYALFNSIKEMHGGVDVCINNAGFSYDEPLLEGTPDQWRNMMDVNVIAVCLCAKLSIKSMRERGVDDGHIININSISGHIFFCPSPKGHYYGATKHALKAVTEGLRQELREANSHIRVSSISPGRTETEFGYVMHKNPEVPRKTYASMACLQGEDITSVLLHILSAPTYVEINEVLVRPRDQKI